MGWLKSIFQPTVTVAEFGAIRAGRAEIQGVVKSGPGDDLRSPVKNVPCVAFFYRALYSVQGRGGLVERTLHAAEVHSPLFYLELPGGRVRVVSDRTKPFTAAEHRHFLTVGFERFQAEEQLVSPGARIAIKGRVEKDAEGWLIRPKQIRFLDPETKKERPEPRRRSSNKRRPSRR